jgi:Ca2+-binding EF-hand superfamily protein
MATEQNKRELQEKLDVLVVARFGGDYKAAFAHYDADHDGSISNTEVKALLADAGIGSRWSRWAWANAIIKEVDCDGDGLVSWPEFTAVFEARKNQINPTRGLPRV